MTDQDNPKIALFVTCLVDLMRPSVAWASLRLLERAGFEVEVPESQTCCGQPAYNSGDTENAKDMAKATIEAFAGFKYVVVPSGSCAGMINRHFPDLLKDDAVWAAKARNLSRRTFELTHFLAHLAKRPIEEILVERKVKEGTRVTYHDSCSSLREQGVKEQPRKLLSSLEGLALVEMENTEVCCGFGGTFCVKYPDISNRMVEKKLKAVQDTGADMLLAGDLGCLLNISGKAKREGKTLQVRHIAEVLDGDLDTPAIGEGK